MSTHSLPDIGHTFQTPDLLRQALTHPSTTYESKNSGTNNQRLEFLGDAVLQLVLTHHLYQRLPELDEGILTKLRSRLVRRETLAAIAAEYQIGDYLILGKGENQNAGRTRPSNLADALEAVIAAIYLDSGLEAAQAWILLAFEPSLREVVSQPVENNPKGILQEYLQSQGLGTPEYKLIAQSGPDHSPDYTIAVLSKGKELARGNGSSKKNAEANAAQAAIDLLETKIKRSDALPH